MRIASLALIELDVANACSVHTRELSEQLALLGHDVTLILPRPLRPQTWTGVRHVWVRGWGFDRARQMLFFLESAWHLARLHLARRFDVLYVRELPDHPFLHVLARWLRLPLFIEVNGWALDDLRHRQASERELRRVARRQRAAFQSAAGILVSTAGNAENVIRQYGIPARQVLVQELGTNPQHFVPGDARRARRELGLPVDARIILFAGSFHPDHHVSALVDVFARLAAEDRRLVLLLVGQGASWRTVQKQRESLGLVETVLIPGSRPYEEMPRYFQAADLAVLPLSRANIRQRNGCITLKLWDYMAAGLPVLATDFPDTPSAHLLQDKVYRIAPEDPQAMADGLRDLLAHDELRSRLGSAGLEYVRKHRTWRQAAGETVAFLRARLNSA